MRGGAALVITLVTHTQILKFVACLALSALIGCVLFLSSALVNLYFTKANPDGTDIWLAQMVGIKIGPWAGLALGVLPACTIGQRPVIWFMGWILGITVPLACITTALAPKSNVFWSFWIIVLVTYVVGWRVALAMVRPGARPQINAPEPSK